MFEEYQEQEQEQRMDHNFSTSRDIFEKKKNMFIRVKETKTKLVQQRRHNFYLPEIGLKSYPENLLEVEPDSSLFSSYIDNIYSIDEKTQYSGLVGLRKIFAENPQQAFLQFDAEIIPRFIEFLCYDHIPYFQFEAAWVLRKITFGNVDKIRPILQNGVFPYLKKLLASPKDEITEHIMAGIGNIAAESTRYRDILLKWGMLELLLDKVDKSKIRKEIIWAMSNLCRGDPPPDTTLVLVAIPTICEAIKNENDEEVVSNASWTLRSIVKDQTCLNTIINSGVTPALIRNLKHPKLQILAPSLGILADLLMGTEEQTNKILCYAELLSSLVELLFHGKRVVRRDTCWVLSNIAGGSSDDIEKLIDTPHCLSTLFDICQEDEILVQRQAFWVLSNMTHKANHDQIVLLLQKDIYNLFISKLNCSDDETVKVIILGLTNILRREDLSFEEKQHFRINDVEDGWKKVQELNYAIEEGDAVLTTIEFAELYKRKFAQILT